MLVVINEPISTFNSAVNPVINVPNQLIWSTQGNNFTMECNVEAFPRSVNYWIRGDGKLKILATYAARSFVFSCLISRDVGELIISGNKFGVSEVRDSIFASRMALTVHSFEKSDIGMHDADETVQEINHFQKIVNKDANYSRLVIGCLF